MMLNDVKNNGEVCQEKLEELIQYLTDNIDNTEGHKHHILPKCRKWFPEYINDKENIIRLEGGKHLFAHKLYKQAFPKDPSMFSAYDRMIKGRILFGYSVSEEDLIDWYKESVVMMSGPNNPFYGKTHSPESIAKILATKKLNDNTSATKGYVCVFNPETDVVKFISPTSNIPEGFVLGNNPENYKNRVLPKKRNTNY